VTPTARRLLGPLLMLALPLGCAWALAFSARAWSRAEGPGERLFAGASLGLHGLQALGGLGLVLRMLF